MKKKWLSVLICMSFLVVASFPGVVKIVQAQKDKTVVKEEPDGMSAKKEFLAEKKEFKRKTKEALKDFDKKMDKLEMKAKEAESKAKAEAKERGNPRDAFAA